MCCSFRDLCTVEDVDHDAIYSEKRGALNLVSLSHPGFKGFLIGKYTAEWHEHPTLTIYDQHTA